MQAGTARPIVTEAADDLPAIYADPDKFTQVVTNLVENAVRHGEGTVRVVLKPSTTPTSAPAGVRVAGLRRGRGHAARDAAPGLHEVLDRWRARRLTASASTSSTASPRCTAGR